jgi:hypothetical protein
LKCLQAERQPQLFVVKPWPIQMMDESALAYIHHVGFSDLAREASPYIIGSLQQAGYSDGRGRSAFLPAAH